MMRKLLLTSLLVCLFVSVMAVDKKTALKVALAVLEADTKSDSGIELIWESYGQTKAVSGDDPQFYVYGRKQGGYVVVSGYEAARPVLAYSPTAVFDPTEIPEPLLALLSGYGEMIDAARVRKVSQGAVSKAEWQSYLSGKAVEGKQVVLPTAHWAQGTPYNMYCPLDDHQDRTATGCTNTAMAIVMRYHKWPKAGVGVLPDYVDLKGVSRSGHALGHEYDWDNMPVTDIIRGATDEQKNQVARLMYDLGIMNQATYGSSTGASVYVPEFVAHFNYDSGMERIQRNMCPSNERWEQYIREEIDASRPILYSAPYEGVGHEFVIDGYRDRFFHANFGWGDGSDEFVVVTPFEEYVSAITDRLFLHDMCIGIKPASGDVDTFKAWGEIMLSQFTYEPDVLFWAHVPIANYCISKRTGTFAFGLVREDETVEEVISDQYELTLEGMQRYNTVDGIPYIIGIDGNCVIHSALRPDHTIRLCMKDQNGQWIPVPADRSSIYPMTHGKPLASLCSIRYYKSETDLPEGWNRVSVFLPPCIQYKFLDESGEQLYMGSLEGAYRYEGNWAHDFDHLKSDTTTKTIRVWLRNLTEEVDFKFTF